MDAKATVNDPTEFNWWSVPREWEGETAVIFASGPSLNQEQIDMVKAANVRTIAINRTIAAVPWADVHYFCDYKFYRWALSDPDYADVRAAWEKFKGRMVTISNVPTAAYHLKRGHMYGVSDEPEALATGNNSGYQSINLAYLFGAKKIILLGYDQRAVNGRIHHHKNHPSPTNESIFEHTSLMFDFISAPMATRALVINATPDSRLESFKKMSLQEALCTPA